MSETVVGLAEDERKMLRWGLLEWGGPARPSETLALAMGFESVADLLATGHELAEALLSGTGLSDRDWTRALIAAELCWASDVLGSGVDSVSTLGFSDSEAVVVLRSIQRKLRQAGVLVRGTSL